MSDEYLETDEAADVICSLELLLLAIKRTKNDLCYWKWAIISLHNAIQGSMVCQLSGTANLGACTEKSADKWLKWYNGGRNGSAPNLKLAYPPELFKRISHPEERIADTEIFKLEVDSNHKRAFKLLCNFRNQFTHFQPTSWIIEIAGLPNMTLKILGLIEAISENGWAFRHLDEAQKYKLVGLINEIRSELPEYNSSINLPK